MPKRRSEIEDWIIYGVHHPEFIECTEEEFKESLKIKSSEPPLVLALESLRKVLRPLEDELYAD